MSTYASNLNWTPASTQVSSQASLSQSNHSSNDHCPTALPVTIVQQLQIIAAQSDSFQKLLKDTARFVASVTECLDCWICRKDQQGNFTSFTSLLNCSQEVQAVLSEPLTELCKSVQATGSIQSEPIRLEKRRLLVGAPIRITPVGDVTDLILISCYELKTSQDIDPIWIAMATADHANQWVQARAWTRSEKDKRGLDERLKAFALLAQSQDIGQASRVLVNAFRRLTGAQQVSLVVDRKLLAVSDVEVVDQRSESIQLVKNACEMSLEAGKRIAYQASTDVIDPYQLSLQSYCHANRFDACVSIPLATQFNPSQPSTSETIKPSLSRRAALLIAGSSENFAGEGYLESLEELAQILSQPFDLTLRAHRTISKIGQDWVSSVVRHRWRKIALASALAVVCLLAIPLPYRINCNCEVQPVSRRFIVAPFEGVLEKSLVKNGDVVAKGQLLAQMDGRQLRIELAGLQAELAGAKKRFDSELAAGNIAQSQISKSESDRLKSKISLLNKRTESLEIRSPIDGVVVIGDLDKAEGASLRIGQALFEIAPLNKMYVEVAVPESEIKYAKQEMPVTLKLNAFPFKTWQTQIETIHPSAEVIDNKNVFVAQALVTNDDGSLRPGMKGKAKVRAHWAPLGWSLFHRPWETIRYWMVW